LIRHTLSTLGPKVLATRMVRQYVEELYFPANAASAAAAADHFALARALATWKARVRGEWVGVRVEHIEADGVRDVVQLGDAITIRAFVNLGSLAPSDVSVQVVCGRVNADDRLTNPRALPMEPVEQYESQRWQYRLLVPLDTNGPFGYTVRVLPRHEGLSSPQDLGLQALPAAPAAMTEGVLR